MNQTRDQKGKFINQSDDFWRQKVFDRYGDSAEFVSVGERTNQGETILTVRCSYCGEIKEISSITLRKKAIVVFGCSKRNDDIRRMKNEEFKVLKKQNREKHRLEKLYQPSFIHFCDCGNMIVGRSRKCEKCITKAKRKRDRRKEVTRRIRIGIENDKDISLDSLFDRDNGVCYLCGKVCDWSDFQKVKGAFVVGGSYPTIEHVIPLCDGGAHTWDNVKLACHACNTKKGRKIL